MFCTSPASIRCRMRTHSRRSVTNIYDEAYNFISSHYLSDRKGSIPRLDGHRRQEPTDWIDVMERLRKRWNCYDFQHFINGVKKECCRVYTLVRAGRSLPGDKAQLIIIDEIGYTIGSFPL